MAITGRRDRRTAGLFVLGGWFLLQYAYFSGIGVAQGGNVAYGAHVVGFIFGGLVTLPFVRYLRRPSVGRRTRM